MNDDTRDLPSGNIPHDDDLSESAAAIGSFVGPYKLLQEIGQGGMGTVYMAEQSKPVKRRVALKIIKPGMDSKQVIARFEAERQALAMMEHANIAQVLDMGTTERDRPFFVMELIRGLPITQYCDQRNLTVNQRLELFLAVAKAVQHAHQKGIIHRDLKPSNILVADYDGKPVPKIIDFGLAKALHQQLTDKTMFTQLGQVVGTLEYMSPEQSSMNQLAVDTRTDIYSLGVLLYELLTGSVPFDRVRMRSVALDQVLKIIREEDPPKPSMRISTLESSVEVAAHRGSEPKRLGLLIRGDLDWIVMKAMEKDRDRRYETANGLGMDIQRYLEGSPVVAAPPSASYRLRKFVRRNRLAVIGASLLLGTLVLGVIGTSSGMLWAWQQTRLANASALVASNEKAAADVARRNSDAARARAESAEAQQKLATQEALVRAHELEQVTGYQARMLQQIDPLAAGVSLMADLRGKHVAALQANNIAPEEQLVRAAAFARELPLVNATDAVVALLDQTVLASSANTIESQFADQPLVKASLFTTLGGVYQKLGRHPKALELLRNAYALRTAALGPNHEDALESLNGVAISLNALRADEAEPTIKQLLETSRQLLGEDHPQTLNSQHLYAILLKHQGKSVASEACLRDLLERRRRVLGDDHPDTLSTMIDMGTALQKRDQYVEAEELLRSAIETVRTLPKHDFRQSEISAALATLGVAYADQGKLAEAETCLREALESNRDVLGDVHPATLTSLSNLAIHYQKMGQPDKAEPLCKESLEKHRLLLGNDHRDTITALNNLGMVYAMQGKSAEVEPYWREALSTGRRVLGEDHPDTIVWINNFAGLLYNQEKFVEAELHFRQAYEKFQKKLGDDHSNTIATLSNLAGTMQENGKLNEAETAYREAVTNGRRALGDDHLKTLVAVIGLGNVLALQGEYEEACSLLSSVEARARSVFPGVNARRVAMLLQGLGNARVGLATTSEEFAVATENLLESHQLFSKTRGPDHRSTRDSIRSLAVAYAAWHKAEPGKGFDAKSAEWSERLQ